LLGNYFISGSHFRRITFTAARAATRYLYHR